MLKRLILGLVIIVVVLVVFEIAGLLWLKGTLTRYATFWRAQAHQPGEFTYVALGDSAAQGIGATSPEKGYVGLIAKDITATTGKSVRIVNLSVSGAKIADVLDKQIPQLKNYRPDLVTIEIGANDVAVQYSATAFANEYTQLVAELPKGTVVANMPYFGGRIHRDAALKSANLIIQKATTAHSLPLADLFDTTKRGQSIRNYSFDLFHPTNHGYHNWEAAFWQVIKPTLKK